MGRRKNRPGKYSRKDQDQKKADDGVWRTIIELSGSMINNDELVLHLPEEMPVLIGDGVRPDWFRKGWKVRFSRKITAEELEAGLDVSYRGDAFEEKPPLISRAFDGLAKLLTEASLKGHYFNMGLQDFVIEYLAYSYYDCLTGGCDIYSLYACRRLIQEHSIPLTEEIYPARPGKGSSPQGWYTVADFLRVTEDLEASVKEDLGSNIRFLTTALALPAPKENR